MLRRKCQVGRFHWLGVGLLWSRLTVEDLSIRLPMLVWWRKRWSVLLALSTMVVLWRSSWIVIARLNLQMGRHSAVTRVLLLIHRITRNRTWLAGMHGAGTVGPWSSARRLMVHSLRRMHAVLRLHRLHSTLWMKWMALLWLHRYGFHHHLGVPVNGRWSRIIGRRGALLVVLHKLLLLLLCLLLRHGIASFP